MAEKKDPHDARAEIEAAYASGPHLARPDRAIEEALPRHIKETGTPKTFPGMTLRPLPPCAVPEIVLKSYRIDISKRADRKMAPCAQCSPHAPKYVEGAVIWRPQDGWMRQVGHECVEQVLGSASYTAMLARRVAIDRTHDAQEFLLARRSDLSVILPHLRGLQQVAVVVDGERAEIDRDVRGWHSKVRQAASSTEFRLVVYRERKIERDEDRSRIGPRGLGSSSDDTEFVPVTMGVLIGRTFLDRNYDPIPAIGRLRQSLPATGWASEEAALAAFVEISDDAMVDLVAAIRRAKNEARQGRLRLEDARRFLTQEALRGLAKWGADRDAPVPFTIHIDLGAQVAEIRHGGHRCRVQLLDSLTVPVLRHQEPSNRGRKRRLDGRIEIHGNAQPSKQKVRIVPDGFQAYRTENSSPPCNLR